MHPLSAFVIFEAACAIHVYVIRPRNVVDLHNSSVTTQIHDRFIHVKLSFHLSLEKRIVTLPNVLCSK